MGLEPLHTLRFRLADAEFELTSTAAEVARAREMLEPAIADALTRVQPAQADGTVEPSLRIRLVVPTGKASRKKTRKRKKSK